MTYSPTEIRTFSLLGQRGAFGSVICKLASTNDKIFAMTADQGAGAATKRFQETYPDRFINFGISEQNAVGVCAGMANEGLIPFVAFQAVFTSVRAADQVRVMMSYMGLPVKLVGIFSGVTQGDCGPTHFALQDIALFRTYPNVVIISPADGLEAAKAVEAAANIKAPVYLRLSGAINLPMVYRKDYDFEIGKAIKLKDGDDICLIAIGSMVSTAMKIAPLIEADLQSTVRVINMHTISPLDEEAIRSCVDCKLLVTMEEHNIHGGLGSAVAECLALSTKHPKHLIIGTPDRYAHAGEYPQVLKAYGLLPEQVKERIVECYKAL